MVLEYGHLANIVLGAIEAEVPLFSASARNNRRQVAGRHPLHDQHRSDDEVAEWERQRAKLSKGYDGSPWLTGLVTFSGFVAAFLGSVIALLVIANLRHGTVWLSYALILAALVGAHLCLRAVRYQRRRARQSAAGDHGRVTRSPEQ